MEYLRDQVHVVHIDVHYIAASWSRVGVVVWRDETKAEAINLVAAMLAPLAARYPKLGLLQIIEDRCESLDADARAALNKLLRETPGLAYSAVVYEGDGFRAASVRAIVSGLAALARTSFPHRVFASAPEAIDAMASAIEPREPTALGRGLKEAVKKARSLGEARMPSGRPRSGRPASPSHISQLLRKR